MLKTLVFVEATAQGVRSVALEILGRLKSLGVSAVDVVCVGALPAEGQKLLKDHGAENIHLLEDNLLASYSPEGYASALQNFISQNQYDYVLAGSTALGKDLFPRVAGLFDAGMASEVTDFNSKENKFRQPPAFCRKMFGPSLRTGAKTPLHYGSS